MVHGRLGVIAVCMVCLSILTMWAQTVTGFGPIDDHRFISTIFLGKDFGIYVMPELGRFIPLTSQEYVIASNIFGTSAHLFHIISAIKVFLCGGLLLLCLVKIKASNATVVVLWVCAIFSIGLANATIRLQIGEINVLLLLLGFIWAALTLDRTSHFSSTKRALTGFCGLTALALSFLYKELAFVFALAFGTAELVRYYRQTRHGVPWWPWGVVIFGICYIAIYGAWRFNQVTGSYTSFYSTTTWQVILKFCENDPFIIFIVLPLTAFRIFTVIRHPNKHTIYDSFLIASSSFVGMYLVLGIYNTYYFLPAYSFAVCGVAGVLTNHPKFRIKVLFLAGILCANTLPVAAADLQALKLIANNHDEFVRKISRWIKANPLPSAIPRNVFLAGVSPGSGVEVLVSLKIFLTSLGVPEQFVKIRATEPTNNPAISSFYGFGDDSKHPIEINDLLIMNPYHSVVRPPNMSPSYTEIYRSTSEWALPRQLGWHWLQLCLRSSADCMSRAYGNMQYIGYVALLAKRHIAPIVLAPLKSPAFHLSPANLDSRMKAGKLHKVNISVSNTGTETWPASGAIRPGPYVHLAYRWFSESGQMVLEGERFPFPEPIQPNDETNVSLYVKTPKKPGRYKLAISPVQEGVRWFSDIGQEIDVL
jgi:hypothetical protein